MMLIISEVMESSVWAHTKSTQIRIILNFPNKGDKCSIVELKETQSIRNRATQYVNGTQLCIKSICQIEGIVNL